MAERGFYVGIDIDDTYAVASFYENGMKEPATVSMKAGSEVFQIPVQIAKKKGIGQWFIGEEIANALQTGEVFVVDNLLSRALHREEVELEGEIYLAQDLLVLFLKKMLGYISGPYGAVVIEALALCVKQLDARMSKLLLTVGELLKVKKEQLVLLDRKSSFYYFALHQARELWLHDVYLFDYRDTEIRCIRLERNLNTIPQLVTLDDKTFVLEGEQRDEVFYHLLEQLMSGRIISSVYLVGNGFDGDWMKLSLNYMCRGRRAFVGKNLYAKGACYALTVLKGKMPWPYAYIGDNQMKVNVSLAVKNRGKKEFLTLLSAGDTWYDSFGMCEVLLDDTNEIAIWLQPPDSKTANVEKLTLGDLPERENKTTRLRITAKPLSDKQVKIEMRDLGFGEIVKSKDKHWEYIMSL